MEWIASINSFRQPVHKRAGRLECVRQKFDRDGSKGLPGELSPAGDSCDLRKVRRKILDIQDQ